MASMANLGESSRHQRRSVYIPKPVSDALMQIAAIPDHSMKLCKIDFYINLFENEIKNFDAHKSEFPLSINLWKEGVEMLKKERMQCTEMDMREKWTFNVEKLGTTPIRYQETVDRDHDTNLSLGSGSNLLRLKEEERGRSRQGEAVQWPFGSAMIPRRPLKKQRRCWSPELHRKFVEAIESLGGHTKATPKQIRAEMKIEGLTNNEVKSHLQKYRLHIKNLPNSVARPSGYAWLL